MKTKIFATGISYAIQNTLGEGLNGVVYRAERFDISQHLKQTVALKILKSEEMLDIWKTEFESLSQINHQNCVRVFGFEWIDGRPALVLELIEGASLRQLYLAGTIDRDIAEEILAQIQGGLRALHERSVVHGDLSPNNVMITNEGVVKLLDFGCSQMVGQVTPEFAAPEILSGAPPTPHSDLYSLGRLEEFLLAQSSVRCVDNPVDRREIVRTSDTILKNELAGLVKDFLARRQKLVGVETRPCAPKSSDQGRASKLMANFGWPAAKFLAVCGLCCLLQKSDAQRSSVPAALSHVSLRSVRWLEFSVDGSPRAYAPRDLQLPPGSHLLEWRSARGHGEWSFGTIRGEHRTIAVEDIFDTLRANRTLQTLAGAEGPKR